MTIVYTDAIGGGVMPTVKSYHYLYSQPRRWNRGNLERKTYFIPLPMIKALEKVSKETGLSVSELVRRAIGEFLETWSRKKGGG